MNKKFFTGLLCILAAFAFLVSFQPLALAETDTSASDELHFGSDGTFTVLLLSDLQETQYTTGLVLSGETNVLSDYPADLIVLLGDQLEGSSPVLRIGNDEQNCIDTINALLEPVADSGIPFVVVFGNHDYEAPISVEQQVAIYESYATCIGVSYGGNEPECGAFALPVYSSDSAEKAFELYFFDSGSYLANGITIRFRPNRLNGTMNKALRCMKKTIVRRCRPLRFSTFPCRKYTTCLQKLKKVPTVLSKVLASAKVSITCQITT